MKTASLLKLLGLTCALPAGSTHAHGLWIEQTGDTKTLFYGEPDHALKERSPGKLDTIRAPQAVLFARDGSKRVDHIVRGTTGFDLGTSSVTQAALASESTAEVKDWTQHGLGVVKPMYYARFAPAPLASAKFELPLDIVPAGGTDGTFLVTFNGQPLAKAKVLVIAPNTWTQEHAADAQGRVTINTPWRGQYVLEVIHTEPVPGEFGGKPYQSSRHRTTLTLVQPTGEEVKQVVPPRHAVE